MNLSFSLKFLLVPFALPYTLFFSLSKTFCPFSIIELFFPFISPVKISTLAKITSKISLWTDIIHLLQGITISTVFAFETTHFKFAIH